MRNIVLKNLRISGIYCEVCNLEFEVPDNGHLKVRDVMQQLASRDFRFEMESDFGDVRDQNPTSMSWTMCADQKFFNDEFSIPDGTYKLESGVKNGVLKFFKYTVLNREMQIVSGDSMAISFGHPMSPDIEDGFSIYWDVVEYAAQSVPQKVLG